jgi:cell division protein FtsI/penicillin-binding protein 2
MSNGVGIGRPRRRVPRIGLAAAVVVLLVAGLVVGVVLSHSRPSAKSTDKADAAAAAFATAWRSGNFGAVTYADDVGADTVSTAFATIAKGLDATGVNVTAGKTQPDPSDPSQRTASLHTVWTLPLHQAWSVDTSVTLRKVAGQWEIVWHPSVVQANLQRGDTLRYTRVDPTRASILDGAGQPLITDQQVVDIGVEPSLTHDPTATAQQLSQALTTYGIDPVKLANQIQAAPPTQFVEVISLRQDAYAPLDAAVSAVPGVVLHHLSEPLTPSHDFARSLLGHVGPVTKEILDASKGRYVVGDLVGLDGLEREFDTQLAGIPGYRIDIVHPSVGGSTPLPTNVGNRAPVDGTPLRTTLDRSVQTAADAALSTISGQPSALVAVRVSTGQVVAVANGPDGGGYDNALLAQAAPGSAFKLVTTTALLEQGLDVAVPVACPPTVVVQGKTFHNYEGEQLNDPPFRVDFAKSCNTAFIGLSSKVQGDTLPRTAAALGIGACWSLGTPAFTGKVPAPASPVDLAAAAFGQGKTIVSPVSLAVAAATIARGSYLAPTLVENGTPSNCGGGAAASSSTTASPSASGGSAAPAVTPGPPPSAAVFAQLRSLMRDVVTSGTATVLNGAPGGPVMAKTGTAEYGSATPPNTHAWIVGYQGDIAFAVYVQDGKSGGDTAGPVALSFLQHLAGSAG